MSIKSGDYLLSRRSTESYITIRQVGEETDTGFQYVQLAPDYAQAHRGTCSEANLRAWGKPISEDEAYRFIPKMDEQRTKLRHDEGDRDRELAATIAPAIIRAATDEALITELEQRGYVVRRQA